MNCKTITVDENSAGKRLDVFLSEAYEDYSRSYLRTLVDEKYVLLNGYDTKAGVKLKAGDVIELRIPEVAPAVITAQDIPLSILYEDEDIAVINKPQGMVVHPAAGNPDGTLVNALLCHIQNLSGINGEMRPGIVHRLDKDTSGLIIIAKNDKAHGALSRQLSEREIRKTYVALVHGNVKADTGEIDAPIGRDTRDRKKMAVTPRGRDALTGYRVLRRYGEYTLLEIDLKTGRTHQIRVHLKYIGHPVVGDPVYTKQKNKLGAKGQLLHAQKLSFNHPVTGEALSFEAPLPGHFSDALERIASDGM